MTNTQTQPILVVDLVKTASIDAVFLALRTPFMGTRIEVTDDRGRVFRLQVQGLYHEDGSGRSLVIKGYAELEHVSRTQVDKFGSRRYEAYLDFKGGGRRGWIKFFD